MRRKRESASQLIGRRLVANWHVPSCGKDISTGYEWKYSAASYLFCVCLQAKACEAVTAIACRAPRRAALFMFIILYHQRQSPTSGWCIAGIRKALMRASMGLQGPLLTAASIYIVLNVWSNTFCVDNIQKNLPNYFTEFTTWALLLGSAWLRQISVFAEFLLGSSARIAYIKRPHRKFVSPQTIPQCIGNEAR